MTGQGSDVLFYILLLILPLSALLSRRIPVGATLKMALAWLAIFATGLLIVSQRDRFGPAMHWASGILYGNDQMVSGGAVRLRKQADGHFWANVSINGVNRRLLIDSGATTTALSTGTANAAGIDLKESPFGTIVDTANGPVSASVATAKSLKLDSITATDLPVVVAANFGDEDVLGMNFLSRLKSWRVEGDWLVLEPASK